MIVFMWKLVWVGLPWREKFVEDEATLQLLCSYLCYENSINNSSCVACFSSVCNLVLSSVSLNIYGICMKPNICNLCGRYS
jgi:hypothetical protein